MITASKPRRRGLRGILLAVTVAVTLLVLSCFMAACGRDDSDRFTPPPATIIRASDTVEPTATAERLSKPTDTRLLPPTRPLVTPASAADRDYPLPQGTPQAPSTPVPYPYPTE